MPSLSTSHDDDADYLIIGAGCAGLSLAVHLVRAGLGRDRRLVVLDPRRAFPRDRTWCAFDVHPHPFGAAVSHRWRSWSVHVPGRAPVVRGSSRYAYEHIPADAFYREALAQLAAHPGVELRLGATVTALDDAGDAVRARVTAADGASTVLTARLAFDSRPVPLAPRAPRGHTRLVQHFLGQQVRAARPVFDPGVARLMDFAEDPGAAAGVHFVYVLPFDECTALVEDTYFGAEPHADPARYRRAIGAYLRARFGLSPDAYAVEHEEHGVIPMTTEPFPARPSPRVHRIGVAGGLAKPSTGYAFAAIQRHSAAFAPAILREPLPAAPPPRSTRAAVLDRVFLAYLARRPARARDVFHRLFERVPADAMVRFLSDASPVGEDLTVMTSVPALEFLAEVAREAPAIARELVR